MRFARLQSDRSMTRAAICCISAFVLAWGVGVTVAEATQDPFTQSTPSKDATRSSNAQLRQERKAKAFQNRRQAVLEFLEQHYPELQESLLASKEKSLGKFRSAINRLEKDVIRLQNVEQKQPKKFELAVEQWKLKTQIEITIAKYSKEENDDQLEQRLRPLIVDMLDIRKSLLELDRQSVSKRLAKIDKRLLKLETNPENAIQHNLRLFRKSANRIRAKQKKKSIQGQPLESPSNVNVDSSEEKR